MTPQVHDLLHLGDLDAVRRANPDAPPWVWQHLAPAAWVVVRRPEASNGLIPAGARGDGRTQRHALDVPEAAITEVVTPHGVDHRPADLALASFTQIDLADPASIKSGITQIGGRVHALFNCAGATPLIPQPELMKVNFLGTRLLTELVTPLMPTGSAIVSVASDGGTAWRKSRELILEFLTETTFDGGLAWYTKRMDEVSHAYAFGKEALIVWTMQQSAQLIGRGIRINTTSPGAVQTPMLKAIEAAYPPELIKVTEQPFLNSDDAAYVNGIDFPVDGGYTSTLAVAGQNY